MNRGIFLDRSKAERRTLHDIIVRYETEMLGSAASEQGLGEGFPKSEEDRLLSICDVDSNNLLGLIVQFAINTAMRQGEIVEIRWDDIDLERYTAIVRGTQGTVTKNGDIR